MRRSRKKQPPDRIAGIVIGLLSALYFADNIEPINRSLSYIQFEIIEFGVPSWLARFLIFAAIVTPGILLGQLIQKSAGNILSAERDSPGTTLGQITGGFVGYIVGLFVIPGPGYFEGGHSGGQYPDLEKLLTDWLILVGPMVVGVLAGRYLQRLFQK
ncbi:MAG: hypothetical protein ACI9JL_000370 [Paracoccaceae bacterium]|jgi:hypothetical protein